MIEPFVDAAWLAAHLPEVTVADVRWYLDGRSGRAAYDAGHIAGAVFVELDTALSGHGDPAAVGRHPLPEPEAFAEAMAALGIGDDDVVIAYDDAGGVIAARLVWMLRAIDHDAAVLNGGLQAWPGRLSTAGPARPPARFTARAWPASSTISIELVRAAAADGRVLLDARPRERYLGGTDAVDPRAGHIPGARSVPGRENLDAAGRLLGKEALRARFQSAGVRDGADVISYCGSGVTACHNLLAIEHAGLGRGRLFPGSWSQWSRDPSRPAAVGDEPGA